MLRTDMDTMSENGSAVTLMTIHSAKGLEFDCVFVAGMEETLFPHSNSSFDPQGLEEERRLAYVAITRARKRLYLTNAFTRTIFGQSTANPASRFIAEIPQELRKSVGTGSSGFSGSGWENGEVAEELRVLEPKRAAVASLVRQVSQGQDQEKNHETQARRQLPKCRLLGAIKSIIRFLVRAPL